MNQSILKVHRATQQCLANFDEEEAYVAARNLFPTLGEKEQRAKGYEILFREVRELLSVGDRQWQSFCSAREFTLSYKANGDFYQKLRCEDEKVQTLQSELAQARAVLTEAKLVKAAGLYKPGCDLAGASQDFRNVEQRLLSAQQQRAATAAEQVQAGEKRTSLLRQLERANEVEALVFNWMDRMLSSIATSEERRREEERLDRLADVFI